MSKIKRFRIHQSIYNTYILPAKRTPTTTHTHHTVHRTSVGSITSITSITNTTIATTHTHSHTRAHIHTPTTVPPAAASSQHHNIVPFQSTTNTFATFNLHFTAAHTTTQPSTYLYLFHRLRAIQPHTLYKQTT